MAASANEAQITADRAGSLVLIVPSPENKHTAGGGGGQFYPHAVRGTFFLDVWRRKQEILSQVSDIMRPGGRS
jgi:hypothetical protein